MKTIDEILDEWYPTISNDEHNGLYARDKVKLIAQEFAEQHLQTNDKTQELKPILIKLDELISRSEEMAQMFQQNKMQAPEISSRAIVRAFQNFKKMDYRKPTQQTMKILRKIKNKISNKKVVSLKPTTPFSVSFNWNDTTIKVKFDKGEDILKLAKVFSEFLTNNDIPNKITHENR
jgi:hypothetical protein